MKVLITGAHGLLGQKLALIMGAETRWELLLTDLTSRTFFINKRFDYQQLDIRNRNDVKSLIAAYTPDVIVNTAAMTDVDACESDKVAAWSVNVDGLKHLMIGARRIEGCRIVQISSDYVFDGTAPPYDEQSRPSPLGYYGKSKLAAENALLGSSVSALLLRTQVLYGTGYELRPNFVSWVLDRLERNEPVKVVDDQIGNPTLADDLAWGIVKLLERRCEGIYHVSGPEAIDRYSFACRIAQTFGFDTRWLKRISTAELGQNAPRPADSAFITLKFEAACNWRMSNVARGLERLRYQIQEGAEHTDLLSDARFQ
jgi:dTDP-4-dehydrorhamnose reductase